MSELFYLASPYSHPSKDVRIDRYWHAVTKAAELMEAGACVFSPIAHTHEIGLMLDRPVDHDFWLRQDKAVLERCTKLLVLKLPGWDQSRGVAEEIAFAKEHGMPIDYLDP